jgi:hypothetical protein
MDPVTARAPPKKKMRRGGPEPPAARNVRGVDLAGVEAMRRPGTEEVREGPGDARKL